MQFNPRLFPAILIVLDLCAALGWCLHGDIRRMIYWIAAAVLTASITF